MSRLRLSDLKKMLGNKSKKQASRRVLGCEALEDRRVLATFNVPADGTIDDAATTLNADCASAPHTININANATAAGEVILNCSTTINGNGNTLTGSGSARVLHFNDGDPYATTVNAVNDLTVTGGDTTVSPGPYGSYAGAGIRSTEELTITGSTITGNTARAGGGISNAGGTLNITDSYVTNNTAAETAANGYSSVAGGILNGGAATVTRTEISGNSATHDDFANYGAFAGGISHTGTTLEIVDSQITGNSAELGGGVYLGPDTVTNISNTQIDGNEVVGYGRGGGLYVSGYYDNLGGPIQYAELTMTGGSISNNLNINGLGTFIGGGMLVGPDTKVSIIDTEISGNTARETGGGIYATSFSSAAGGYVSQTQLSLTNVKLNDNVIPYAYNAAGGAVFPYGGGIMAGRGSVITITGGEISGNRLGDANDGNARGAGLMSDNFSYGNPNATNDVTLDGVTVSGNVSDDLAAFGAGLSASQGGNLLVKNSTISGNSAGVVGSGSGVGGGIGLLFDASVTVQDSLIDGNFSEGDAGAIQTSVGAAAYFYSAFLTVERSTLSNNVSGFDGGGISSYSSETKLVNTTISGNTNANEGSAIWHLTGAYSGGLEINFSTFTNNTGNGGGSAYYGGGTIYDTVGTGPGGFGGVISNSIVSGNAGPDVIDPDSYLAVTYSLVEDATFAPSLMDGVSGNIVGTAATLGPLAANGAVNGTLTHELLGPAGAIGGADPAATEALDGRGLGRPGTDGLRDMGAYETDADVPGDPADLNMDGFVNCADMDLMVADVAAGGSTYDPNMDGMTNIDDVTFVRIAGGINPADFNCDGVTDVSDFGIWNSAKFTATGLWSAGDANADGVTDVSDFGIWNAAKFTSFDGDAGAALAESFGVPHAAGVESGDNTGGNGPSAKAVARAINKGIADLEFKRDGHAMAKRGDFARDLDVKREAVTITNNSVFAAKFESSALPAGIRSNLTIDASTRNVDSFFSNQVREQDSAADDRLRVSAVEANVDDVFAGLDSVL